MKEIKRIAIKMYAKDNGDCPIITWLESLDPTVRYRIKSRLARVSLGNLGEYKILGDRINELKFKNLSTKNGDMTAQITKTILMKLILNANTVLKVPVKISKDSMNEFLKNKLFAPTVNSPSK